MTEHRPNMTPAELVNVLDRFISDNRHSHDVDARWLAAGIEVLLENVKAVRNGKLPADLKQKVAAFRVSEIVKEMDAKQRDLVDLERQLKLVQRDAGQ